jgi:hypothetical protein
VEERCGAATAGPWAARRRAARGGRVVLAAGRPPDRPVIPPTYNARTPELFGIPFFYWPQRLWIQISVSCTAVTYRMTRGRA